jgi:hypothetical protein
LDGAFAERQVADKHCCLAGVAATTINSVKRFTTMNAFENFTEFNFDRVWLNAHG